MLAELGLSAIELDDGSKVTVQATYGAHIKVADREEPGGSRQRLRGHHQEHCQLQRRGEDRRLWTLWKRHKRWVTSQSKKPRSTRKR